MASQERSLSTRCGCYITVKKCVINSTKICVLNSPGEKTQNNYANCTICTKVINGAACSWHSSFFHICTI